MVLGNWSKNQPKLCIQKKKIQVGIEEKQENEIVKWLFGCRVFPVFVVSFKECAVHVRSTL